MFVFQFLLVFLLLYSNTLNVKLPFYLSQMTFSVGPHCVTKFPYSELFWSVFSRIRTRINLNTDTFYAQSWLWPIVPYVYLFLEIILIKLFQGMLMKRNKLGDSLLKVHRALKMLCSITRKLLIVSVSINFYRRLQHIRNKDRNIFEIIIFYYIWGALMSFIMI